jgi:hypothetical protein
MNYSIKIYKKDKEIYRYKKHSIRLFLKKIRTINWKNNEVIVCLRFDYGKGFVNEGIYSDETDFWVAFNAFREEE